MKTALLSINFLGLFIYQLFFSVDASIVHEPPAQLAAGESVEVTVSITKPGITGPAQLRLYLSEGLTAEMVDGNGASFTFDEDHNAVFIWMGIPADDQLDVVYKLTASENTGLQTISGKFSYLENEERKKIMISETTIEITGGDAVADNTTDDNATDDTIDNTDDVVDDTPEPIQVAAVRNIEDLGTGEYMINVSIALDGGTGFGRMKDQIPAGLTAVGNETAGGSFKFESNAATIVWTDVSAGGDVLNVSYKLIPDEGVSGEFIIMGEFTSEFLINDGSSQAIDIPAKSLLILETVADNTDDITDDVVDDTTDDVTDDTTDDVTDDTTDDVTDDTTDAVTDDTTDDVTDDTTDAVTDDTTDDVTDDTTDDVTDDTTDDRTTNFPPVDDTNVTDIPSPEKGISYRVQICAGHKTVSSDYFSNRHGYSGAFQIENHEGWVKYTVGSFATYKDARNERETLNSYTFQGPFVTAYNEGQRITVQEALMISNQNWVQ